MTTENLRLKINRTLCKFDEFRGADMNQFTDEIIKNIEIYTSELLEFQKKEIITDYLNNIIAEL